MDDQSIAFFVSGGSNMITPSLEDFRRMASQGNLIPVFEEIHYDLETPLSAFRKIDDGKSSFLLESVEGGVDRGNYHPGVQDSLPRFSGGAVGYLSYDVVRSFEKIPEQLQQDLDLDDCSFMITDTLLAFDNLKKKIKVIVT